MPRYTYVPLSQALSEVARTTRYVVAASEAHRFVPTGWNHAERRPMTPEEEDVALWMGWAPIRTADLAEWARTAEARGELAVRARVASGVILGVQRRPLFAPWDGEVHLRWFEGDEVRHYLVAALETEPDLRTQIEAALAVTRSAPPQPTEPEVEPPDRYARVLDRG